MYQALQFIKFYFSARGSRWLHSPFVYDFYSKSLKLKNEHPEFKRLSEIYSKVRSDKKKIQITDLGTGSSRTSTASSILKRSSSSLKQAHLLMRIVQYFNPKSVLELGTNLGLSSAALALSLPDSRVTTLEGAEDLVFYAGALHRESELDNIDVIQGDIDDILRMALNKLDNRVDLAYIDANHSYDATIKYFNIIRNNSHSSTVLIFDDIYWSAEMTKAWKEIQRSVEDAVTIDLFHLGLVCFTDKQPKQHFKLRI